MSLYDTAKKAGGDIADPEFQEQHLDKSFKHWENRSGENWEKFEFKQPYARGLDRVHKVLEKTNFDPATLWQWGTMQAMALIDILKNAEKTFGSEGQKLVLDSLKRTGYDIGRQIVADTNIHDDIGDDEWISYYATIINRVAYASLETPEIKSKGEVVFDIDFCPHQDMYSAFDCRVQRYFVQGMLDAALEFCEEQGRDRTVWDVAFQKTIPAGAPTCYFRIREGDANSKRRWAKYTEVLEQKALRMIGKEQDTPDVLRNIKERGEL